MYRLVISVIRGTSAGRALSMMASGTQICADTPEGAGKLYEEFVDAAHAVLANVTPDICMGMVSILNTKTGEILASQSLMGCNK